MHASYYLYIYVFLLSFITTIHSVEYVYPVGSPNNGETLFLMHQTAAQQTELLEWNSIDNTIEQSLWSLFNPTKFELLPNNEGFSFIDNGRLRIKYFNKRSAKAIDFDKPIFNISFMKWITSDVCYCSAQQNNEFALFLLNNKGMVSCIAAHANKDYMYPQKIDNDLFYIERDKKNSLVLYRIMQTSFPFIKNNINKLNFTDISLKATMIVDFNERPIIFLTMISLEEGFVIEHQKIIDSDDKTMIFFYYHIIKKDCSWHKKELFSFTIPSPLLMPIHDEALYESILPLLPRKIHNKVFFTSCSSPQEYSLVPYYYDLTTNTITKVSLPALPELSSKHVFVPMLCGKELYCGGAKMIKIIH